MQILSEVLIVIALVLINLMYCSVFEWTLHRYVMHRPVRWLRGPFEAHALRHHSKFGWGSTYHLGNEAEADHISMQWYHGPILITITTFPLTLVGLITGWWLPAIVTLVVCTPYYGMYEYMHWVMHKPKERWVERLRVFRWISEHHRLHHKYMGKYNFNVYFPFADWLLGTLRFWAETEQIASG